MKVLIGAIGLGKYDGTTYLFEDGTKEEADYFAYALTRHVKPDHLFVIATEAAKAQALPDLQDWIALEDVPITVVDIPNGKNRLEAWDIFNNIVAKFDETFPTEKSMLDVYIDITNGLRSIPVLLLSIVRYLQRSRHVNLRGIFYGAYDAVDRQQHTKPVYQLDSFVMVLDWANAVETFLETGSSVLLANMLKTQEYLFTSTIGQSIANALKDLSQALDLVQIEAIHRQSHILTEAIVQIDFDNLTNENRIIADLLLQLRDDFEPLAMENTTSHLREFLVKDMKLILWYYRRKRYQDAMLVAREWMLTYKMQHSNARKKKKYTSAEIFERHNRDAEDGYHQWGTHDKKTLHEEINNLRNLLAHCGFSDQDDSIEALLGRVDAVMAKLQQLEKAL